MKKIIVYIANSLDGYIADKNMSIDWLNECATNDNEEGSYDTFYNSIDTVILGKTTYNQIIKELSPTVWPYSDKMTYVITNDKIGEKDNIKASNDLVNLVNKIKNEEGKNIWICGGASIINTLIKADLIDEFHITIVPIILGGGVKLFDNTLPKIKLKLINTKKYNGYVDLIYIKD